MIDQSNGDGRQERSNNKFLQAACDYQTLWPTSSEDFIPRKNWQWRFLKVFYWMISSKCVHISAHHQNKYCYLTMNGYYFLKGTDGVRPPQLAPKGERRRQDATFCSFGIQESFYTPLTDPTTCVIKGVTGNGDGLESGFREEVSYLF